MFFAVYFLVVSLYDINFVTFLYWEIEKLIQSFSSMAEEICFLFLITGWRKHTTSYTDVPCSLLVILLPSSTEL